jgi:DNA-binding NtrC family response regulator
MRHNSAIATAFPSKSASQEFLEYLAALFQPGNVRELINVLESSIAAAFR